MSPSLSQEEARRRLGAATFGVLATITSSGLPHVVPVTFALSGDVAVSAVDHKPKRSTDLQRLRNLAANRAAALLVHHDDPDWSRLWWVRADGPASVVEDSERRAEALAALAAKYDQYRERPPEGPVIALAIERLVGWAAIPGP